MAFGRVEPRVLFVALILFAVGAGVVPPVRLFVIAGRPAAFVTGGRLAATPALGPPSVAILGFVFRGTAAGAVIQQIAVVGELA